MNLPTATGRPALVGVVHLHPLPGSPSDSPGLDVVEKRALEDARALVSGGVDAVIMENLGDTPFTAGSVPPDTVSQMTRIALALREVVPGPLGINVLRNDGLAALAIAHACGAEFIRVNVLTGTVATDQGVITGIARELAQARRRLGADVAIAADVDVKHGAPLVRRPLAQLAQDTVERGGADALIVTGSGTGKPIDPADLETVRSSCDAPLWAGSGVTPERITDLGHLVDAAIVGTYFHRDSKLDQPVDAQRVARLRAALDAVQPPAP